MPTLARGQSPQDETQNLAQKFEGLLPQGRRMGPGRQGHHRCPLYGRSSKEHRLLSPGLHRPRPPLCMDGTLPSYQHFTDTGMLMAPLPRVTWGLHDVNHAKHLECLAHSKHLKTCEQLLGAPFTCMASFTTVPKAVCGPPVLHVEKRALGGLRGVFNVTQLVSSDQCLGQATWPTNRRFNVYPFSSSK